MGDTFIARKKRKRSLRNVNKQLDKVVRRLVKERTAYTCEHCGKEEHNRRKLQWSHHLSGFYVKNGLRWSPYNAAAHCAECHGIFTKDPVAHGREIIRLIGDGMYQILCEKRDEVIAPPDVHERIEMIEHYQTELGIMLDKRKDGEYGYIDFMEW